MEQLLGYLKVMIFSEIKITIIYLLGKLFHDKSSYNYRDGGNSNSPMGRNIFDITMGNFFLAPLKNYSFRQVAGVLELHDFCFIRKFKLLKSLPKFVSNNTLFLDVHTWPQNYVAHGLRIQLHCSKFIEYCQKRTAQNCVYNYFFYNFSHVTFESWRWRAKVM